MRDALFQLKASLGYNSLKNRFEEVHVMLPCPGVKAINVSFMIDFYQKHYKKQQKNFDYWMVTNHKHIIFSLRVSPFMFFSMKFLTMTTINS